MRVYRDEYINGRRVRKRKRIRLAPASMPVREVQKVKAEYLRPLNQGLISAGSATPFEGFVNTVYKTTALPLLASSTQDRYRGIVDLYLIPTFGSLCLRDLTPLTLQSTFPDSKSVSQMTSNKGTRRRTVERRSDSDANPSIKFVTCLPASSDRR
jgi:hypothetical protein